MRIRLSLSFNLPVDWIFPIHNQYLSTLPVFPGVSKFFIKSPGLSECLLGDYSWILSLMTFSQCKDF